MGLGESGEVVSGRIVNVISAMNVKSSNGRT